MCSVAHGVCFSSYFQATAAYVVCALFQAGNELSKAGTAKRDVRLSSFNKLMIKDKK